MRLVMKVGDKLIFERSKNDLNDLFYRKKCDCLATWGEMLFLVLLS